MSKDELPSIEDFNGDDNLPSIKDFITEEKAEELPSVEDYVEKKEEILTEATQTIEDADGNSFTEIKDIVPPWPELVKMVNDVRADIPDIPEIKYYDKELEDLAEQISRVRDEIPEVPEVRYYEKEVEAICEQIDLVREQIKDLPEVKYYDEQVNVIEDRIDTLQTEVTNLPEVKYYDREIEAICSAIDQVRSEIPNFPKWVNEVNEVPDFSWIGKTFSVIDDDFTKVNDSIDTLKENIQLDIKKLVEDNEVRHFESKIEVGNEVKDLNTKLGEEKDKIWKELRDSSMKIWEYHREFKDDDRKLKKQILGEYNTLKQNIKKELKEVTEESVKTDELLLKYFTDLREEVSGIVIPEVKYYDDDLSDIRVDIASLKKLVQTIKTEQKNLSEGLLNEPPNEKESVGGQSDPLTPMDQNFATLDDLSKHYRLFINRIQEQISTIGGGGAGFVKDLDDVDISGLADNYILQYDAATSKWLTVANNPAISGVGINSGSTRIGTGFTDFVFSGAGVSSIVGSGTTVTIDIPATTIKRQVATASGITTNFTVTGGYTAGFIDVFLNGVKQRSGTDFTATNGTTVTMVPFINDGDVLEFQVYENLTIASQDDPYSGTTGQLLQHNGSTYVGVSSVGIATFINDHHQGYYRYSTNYYTAGVANTVQTLPSDEFVLIQPSVRTNKTEFMPQVMLNANSSNPWVGSGATIGTGQTQFSLAGLDDGSTVVVRIASQFNPDDDNTNLDFRLNFTTNPTTQGYGTTNFSITREQALIMNEGADQNYISETIMNFYVGSSLSGLTTTTAGSFNISARASNEGDFEMMALTINVVA